MQDVADYAGVSLKTVSRVVNREPGVSADLEQRVRDTIATLGFRRNEAARLLARGRSIQTVGLVIENIRNEFYATVAKSVEDAVTQHDALVVVGSYEERLERERLLVDSMHTRGVQSIIVVPAVGDHSWVACYQDMGLRTVFLDRIPQGLDEPDCVLIDNSGGARLATEHLIAQGHRRIGYVAHEPTVTTIADRTDGYRQALAAAGIPFDERLVVSSGFAPTEAAKAVGALLDSTEPPTAFFASNNRTAIGVYQALQGRSGPPVALVGFDDFELAEVLAISVVRYNPVELASVAVDLLFDTGRPGGIHTVGVELARRGSGELSPTATS